MLFWTSKEEILLRKIYSRGSRRELMAALPDRTWRAIKTQASRLGVKKWKEILPAGFKRCANCEEVKSLEGFYRDRNHTDGRKSRCKICEKDRQRRYNIEHHEELLEYWHRYKADHRKEIAEYNRTKNSDRSKEYRTREAGAEGSHTRAEFDTLCDQYGLVCLCCGIPHSESPLTRDHVIPLSRGGSNNISNIQPLCGHCNDSKGTKTIDYRQNSGMVVAPGF